MSNRSIVKRDSFAIITPQGRVTNVIPGIKDAIMTILCTPKTFFKINFHSRNR